MMTSPKQTMPMPELLVFVRMLVLGIVGAEVCRVTFYMGGSLALTLHPNIPFIRQAETK
ncbi:MAG: hypothetical protein RL497_1109 [Pseudomonadota bacterium]|jgi:hypothetical protein